MIIYEVNLKIPLNIYSQYIIWLKKHINDMLVIKGFIKAKTYYCDKENEVIVHYYIDNINSYDKYIKYDASKMRNIPNFASDVNIKRRLLNEKNI